MSYFTNEGVQNKYANDWLFNLYDKKNPMDSSFDSNKKITVLQRFKAQGYDDDFIDYFAKKWGVTAPTTTPFNGTMNSYRDINGKANKANSATLGNFTFYGDTTEGKRDAAALKAADDALKALASSSYATNLNDALQAYLDKEDFSYDVNQDALYQQLKDNYVQQGKMVMADTMGQAVALTGGYGNSYAQSVGQQAYAAQLENLNDVVPELYQMALDNYARESDELLNAYSLYANEYEREYGRLNDEYNRAYSTYYTNQDNYNKEQETLYGRERDKVEDEQWYASLYAESGGTAGYDNGGLSADKINTMLKFLGLDPDGKWGAAATGKANGLTAAEAWQAYQNGTLGRLDLSYEDIENEFSAMLGDTTISNAEIEQYLEEMFEDGYITEEQKANFLELLGRIPNRAAWGK